MATVTVLPLTLERGEYCQTRVHLVLAAEAKLVRNSLVGFGFALLDLAHGLLRFWWCCLLGSACVRQVYDGDAQNRLCASGSINVCVLFIVYSVYFNKAL